MVMMSKSFFLRCRNHDWNKTAHEWSLDILLLLGILYVDSKSEDDHHLNYNGYY